MQLAPVHSLPQHQNISNETQLAVQIDLNCGETQHPGPQPMESTIPTPPESDVSTKETNCVVSASRSVPNEALFHFLQRLITCSVCNNIFNRRPLSRDYLFKLNRPVQCACGCVICTICYKEKHGCVLHGLVSYKGTVNNTASELASSVFMDKDQWDLKRNHYDCFKAQEDINLRVQELLHNTAVALDDVSVNITIVITARCVCVCAFKLTHVTVVTTSV